MSETGAGIARARFRVGDRVRMTDVAVGQGLAPRGRTTGEVVGFSHKPYLVRVLRDGTRTPFAYHMDFWAPSVAQERA